VTAAAGWARLDELGEYRALCKTRVDHVVEVREPLVLISQIHRSGGTLLSQLFDAHPECHAHPHELRIGYPSSRHWPPLDLGAPERWFEILYEKYPGKHLERGYSKLADGLPAPGVDADVFPFLFLPRLQEQLFEKCIAERPVERERDILDCYFTSYFNAWLDNQNLYAGPKRVVTAFAPELNLHPGAIDRFFEAYPDGTFISLVRDSRAWYASARSKKASDEDVVTALARWRRSAEAAIAARERYGDRVVVLAYEQLVLDTETTMARLAEHLGISMTAELLTPTFNGRPIRANSSDPVRQHGVLRERARAFRDALDAATLERIEELSGDLYERASGTVHA
jgi:hypothetical protein